MTSLVELMARLFLIFTLAFRKASTEVFRLDESLTWRLHDFYLDPYFFMHGPHEGPSGSKMPEIRWNIGLRTTNVDRKTYIVVGSRSEILKETLVTSFPMVCKHSRQIINKDVVRTINFESETINVAGNRYIPEQGSGAYKLFLLTCSEKTEIKGKVEFINKNGYLDGKLNYSFMDYVVFGLVNIVLWILMLLLFILKRINGLKKAFYYLNGVFIVAFLESGINLIYLSLLNKDGNKRFALLVFLKLLYCTRMTLTRATICLIFMTTRTNKINVPQRHIKKICLAILIIYLVLFSTIEIHELLKNSAQDIKTNSILSALVFVVDLTIFLTAYIYLGIINEKTNRTLSTNLTFSIVVFILLTVFLYTFSRAAFDILDITWHKIWRWNIYVSYGYWQLIYVGVMICGILRWYPREHIGVGVFSENDYSDSILDTNEFSQLEL